MKKILYILTCFLLVPVITSIAGVTQYAFEYDDDGNMTSRKTVVMPQTYSTSKDTEEPEVKNDRLGEQTITIRPNPTRGHVALDILPLDLTVENSFSLYDASGRLIETRHINEETTYIEITGPTGLYLLDIRLGKEVSRWKIIKQ